MASSSSQPNLKAEVESGGGANPVSGDGGGGATASDQVLIYRGGLKKAKKERGCTAKERISKMPPCAAGKRSSIYRGVTRHRWTGRYEAHLWDKSTWNQNQNKKGKQVYLGAYDDEEAAARAYDLAALKYWGPGTLINFPVSDYARDIEEMQNVSREDYLASLRRKSSGFSRGISKYRGLSSRWEQSIGRLAGHQYFNMDYGNDTVTEGEYRGAFCIERKIDLTSYIKWWNTNKSHQEDIITKSSEETKHGCSEDVGSELKSLDWVVQPTEPYQMPQFGTFHEGKKPKRSTVSALSILSQSAAYKSFQERVCRKLENNTENNENEIKSDVNRMDYGKAVEKAESLDGGSERPGVPLGMGGGLPLQRNIHPLNPFLSAPVLTKYSSMDPLTDPILWSSLVPGLPTDLSLTSEVTKREPNSNYTFFTQEE